MKNEKIRGKEERRGERNAERLGGARPLEKEELRSGMWVWNDTKSMYQRIKCVPFQDGNYYWTDSQNNVVEDDVLYRFII